MHLQTKGESGSVPAGISQSAPVRCQQKQFRRLSPHPTASPPEYLSVFFQHCSQVLLLLCAPLSVRVASRVDFVLLCEGLLVKKKKATGGNVTGPAGGTQKEL